MSDSMIASGLSSVLSSSCRTWIASTIITTDIKNTDDVDDRKIVRMNNSGVTDGIETMSVSEEEGTEVTYWTNTESTEGCTSHADMEDNNTAVP